jgi:hypothetical protein
VTVSEGGLGGMGAWVMWRPGCRPTAHWVTRWVAIRTWVLLPTPGRLERRPRRLSPISSAILLIAL